MAADAAWGLPAFGGRFTGAPHAGFGLGAGAREYSLGWRLAPHDPDAPEISLGAKAARREGGAAKPEHAVGLEIEAKWQASVRNTNSGNPDNDPGTIGLSVASGFGIAAAYGFASAGRLRGIEFELGYYRAETDDFSTPDGYPIVWETGNPNNYETTAPALGDVATTSFMVNTYGEFGEGGSSPCLGAGLGVALHQVDVTTDVGILKRGLITTVTDEAVVFAWQVMAGITYKGVRLGYRYFATADADIDGLELTHGRHSVELGVTFH